MPLIMQDWRLLLSKLVCFSPWSLWISKNCDGNYLINSRKTHSNFISILLKPNAKENNSVNISNSGRH